MATDTTRVSSYAQFEGYKDSAGTLMSATFTRLNSALADTSGLTATAATLNKIQYAATSHKVAYGSAVMAAGSSIVSMADNGITTCAFFLATPQDSCVMSVTFAATSATIVMASGAGVVTAGVAHWMAVNA
jgi:hypothetical protein